MEKALHKISVRSLSERLYRTGSLMGASFGGVSGQEGTRVHQRVFKDLSEQYATDSVMPEFSLSTEIEFELFRLLISGRADCVLEKDGNITIFEIKTHNRMVEKVEQLILPTHEAQVKIYAHLFYLSHPDVEDITITLRYVSVITYQFLEKCTVFSREDAKTFFDETMDRYQEEATRIYLYEKNRDESIVDLQFPYSVVRSGQRDFMKAVLSSIKHKETLIAEAPTGIGKTISTLFPSVKWLPHAAGGKIFYTTAKLATREVADKALSDMRSKGLVIKSILLSPKESMCTAGEDFCDSKYCKFADGYYSRLNAALEELFILDAIYPEDIRRTAEKHRICAHELQLDASNMCDVIICDYNHVFHPRVHLQRYFATDEFSHTILVDEAHNMIPRSVDMFSADLNRSTLLTALPLLSSISDKTAKYSHQIADYFSVLDYSFEKESTGLNIVEDKITEKEVIVADNFRATRAAPSVLYRLLWALCFHIANILAELDDRPKRRILSEFYFEARFFLTILELYFNDAYIMEVKRSGACENGQYDICIRLQCLDASESIANILKDSHSAVFFSATMSPAQYYRSMIVGKDTSFSRLLQLPSPFPPENLQVIMIKDIKTTYQDRSFTCASIAETILRMVSGHHDNFMVFFPSFAYMEMVYQQIFKKCATDRSIELLKQTEGMNADEKKDYLARFDRHGDKTLLGFAVLGGHFGEGIDLVGDKLKGAFIVGVGLPQISPEREILSQYYQNKFGDGFAYAYKFPGWEKVLQAAGRVIRNENEKGFIVLMDERYLRPDYLVLRPDHWRAEEYLSTEADILWDEL
ncbi:MAG: ATP-dependent DNA helicase [Clostridiales bacterium]|nr:ATP-dependent DNA helicase [Clostridiales bacterium]